GICPVKIARNRHLLRNCLKSIDITMKKYLPSTGAADVSEAKIARAPHRPSKPQSSPFSARLALRSATSRPDHGNGNDPTALDIEHLLSALQAIKNGDFAARLPLTWTGVGGRVADTFNEVAELMSLSTDELSRISQIG